MIFKVSYSGNATLGRGFNTYSGECKMSKAVEWSNELDFATTKSNVTIIKSNTFIRYIENITEFCEFFGIKNLEGFKLSALDFTELKFNFIGGSRSIRFQDVVEASTIVALCTEVEVKDNETNFSGNNKALTSELLSFAKQCNNSADFIKKYGNGFISGIHKGGVFHGLLIVKSTKGAKLEKIKESIKTMNNILSGEDKTNIEHLQEIFDHCEYYTYFNHIGGENIEIKYLNFVTIFKEAIKFKDSVLLNPAVIYVDVTYYEEMPEFNQLGLKYLKYDSTLLKNVTATVKLIYEYNQLSIMIEKTKNDYIDRLESDNVPNYIKIIHGTGWREYIKKLPSKFINYNKHLRISDDGLKVENIGEEAGTASADVPIPAKIKLFYYETVIVHSSDCTKIGIGMCKDAAYINEMPGKCDHSSGYYGCGSFYYNGQKVDTLEEFTTGDIVGYGYNFVKNKHLLTKNGKKLKIKFANLGLNIGSFRKNFKIFTSNLYYPVIGIGSKDSEVIIRLDDIAYNIEDYIARKSFK
ncbi:13436_t:CDS:10 [Cetraspora pellucida]|uniref:13436_t:CDS:1 n=1 Tax=Cetraspora pellucida TaxID=1433469 RepID=A0A9N8VKS1_9GLOM|nr:13436_t:CDS:10 [Cetraspora pellucida]